MTVYVIVMYRYGQTEAHSYVLGVWSTAREAECAGTVESLWRGGKYKTTGKASGFTFVHTCEHTIR